MTEVKAVVFPAINKAELRSHQLQQLRAGELLIRSEYSGVSQGTEIWAYIGKRPEIQFPTVPGYQGLGTVEQIGAGVTGYKAGQRVMFGSSRLPDIYPETWMGTHVSKAIVPVEGSNLVSVPEGLDPASAALAALPAVSLRGLGMLDVQIGDLVVVNGQGIIGQSSAQLARLRGAIVVAADVNPHRLELSKQYSADIVVNSREQKLADVVKSLKPKGADVVIDTTGRSDQFAPCVDLLRWEGQFLLQGYYPQPLTFDFHTTHMKKPRIAVTCGHDAAGIAMCMELMRYGKLQIRPLASHIVSVNEAPQMYRRMAASDPEIMGVVFEWDKH